MPGQLKAEITLEVYSSSFLVQFAIMCFEVVLYNTNNLYTIISIHVIIPI